MLWQELLHILVINKGDSCTVPFYWTIKLLCINILTFCFRQSNHLTNKLQERALRVTYNDYDSRFSILLEMPNESTNHIKNVKVLMTEIYKFLNDLSPPIINDIFQKQENYYSLRNPRSPVFIWKFTTTYGIDTISFRGS